MTTRQTATVVFGRQMVTGKVVTVPLRHMAICGQTQEAGKTTALEGMIYRSGLRALTFVTKRGEGSFHQAQRIPAYFREQADWQFVSSILEATRGERMKFERAWIIRASRGAKTLRDVHQNIKRALAGHGKTKPAKGLTADVYLVLDAYLDEIVPVIEQTRWAPTITLKPGSNVMDLTGMPEAMQHLVIKSVLDWVLFHEHDVVVVIPEAWKFIPQGRGTPVKLAAERYVRQAAGLRNYLWLDSQDIGGIDKTILRSVPVWVLGVQREANEVKRTLSNIPEGVDKPRPSDVSTLGLGQFYVCTGSTVTRAYAQPWDVSDEAAEQCARTGALPIRSDSEARVVWTVTGQYANGMAQWEPEVSTHEIVALPPEPTVAPTFPPAGVLNSDDEEETMSGDVSQKLDRLLNLLGERLVEPEPTQSVGRVAFTPQTEPQIDEQALFERFKRRLVAEAPALIRVLAAKPEFRVIETREVIEVDGKSTRGRIAKLIANGFFASKRETSEIAYELARTGHEVSNIELGNELKALVEMGFFTKVNKWVTLVDGAVANVETR